MIADEIRARAKKELGLTVSVGVSFGKVFAKLASDLKKPDATTCVTVENFRKVVWPLPARALLYVGPATERRLRERNIRTIGDIAARRPEALRAMLGKHGETLWDVCQRPGMRGGIAPGGRGDDQVHWQQRHARARPW